MDLGRHATFSRPVLIEAIPEALELLIRPVFEEIFWCRSPVTQRQLKFADQWIGVEREA